MPITISSNCKILCQVGGIHQIRPDVVARSLPLDPEETMSRRSNPIVSAARSLLSSSGLQRQNRSRRRSNRRRRNRNVQFVRQPRGILAGYGSALTSSFYTAHTRDGCRVRGLDLITNPITNAINISFFITANPITWVGTRISAIASGFQNYRPLKFLIHYRPQVGSTATSSVFIGTVWQNNSVYFREALEPSLLTSPGGTYLPAWQSSTSVVNLGNALPQRMFPIRDPHFSTVPFAVVARSSNGGPDAESISLPGRIFIEYEYEFRNAIGSASVSSVPTIKQVTLSNPGSGTSDPGWIVDYANIAPSEPFPLFAHLTWDSTTAGDVARINGERVPDNDPTPVALVYTQGPDLR